MTLPNFLVILAAILKKTYRPANLIGRDLTRWLS